MFESLGEFCDHLRQWEKRVRRWEEENNTKRPHLRINGSDEGSDASPWMGFAASGFDDTRFNQTFCLAGDTQRGAVQRFLGLHKESHHGNVLRVFDPGPSRGSSLKLYLRVPEGRRFKGWNCLDGTTSGRRAQLLGRVRK